MPAVSSMIRTVPGANVGPDGIGASEVEDVDAAGVPLVPALPTSRPAPTTSTSTSSEIPMIQPVLLEPADSRISGSPVGMGGRSGGASTGEERTATPGPAGVVTSDHDV